MPQLPVRRFVIEHASIICVQFTIPTGTVLGYARGGGTPNVSLAVSLAVSHSTEPSE
ncbi:MAG: hypothetical protein H7232_11720 [Aeromicrobium sp.]|nr:hypothetical protein [Burkholderiales bacterium]